jgi:hypothetical protein
VKSSSLQFFLLSYQKPYPTSPLQPRIYDDAKNKNLLILADELIIPKNQKILCKRH